MSAGKATTDPEAGDGGSPPGGGVPCPKPCTPCTLTSQTVVTSPTDRARKKIGVGEEVTITVAPAESVTWSVTGGGTVSPTSGTQTTFTADERRSTPTITAVRSDGCKCIITFNVIEPADFTMKRRVGTNLGHTNGRPDCSWFGTMMIHPNDVNFNKVETRELNSTITVAGSYSPFAGLKHQGATQTESAFFPVIKHTDAEGSEVGLADNIATGDPGPAATNAAPPFIPGTHSFPITWQWRVVGKATIRNFPNQRQEAEIFADGRCESRKGGNTERTRSSDPTSTR